MVCGFSGEAVEVDDGLGGGLGIAGMLYDYPSSVSQSSTHTLLLPFLSFSLALASSSFVLFCPFLCPKQ